VIDISWELCDRYSNPTKHNHNDTGKILAICDDFLVLSQAIADLTKLVPLLYC
jgi:hypothetical protein